MRIVRISRLVLVTLMIGFGIAVTIAGPANKKGDGPGNGPGKGKDQPKGEPDKKPGDQHPRIFIRITAFAHAMRPDWDLKDHDGQDVLKMIEQLKPDVLNRFTDGKPNLNLEVPMGKGAGPMKFADYLTAAMKAGAPGCTISPKVHLNKIWSDDYRMQAAQALHDLPVTPRLTMLDLDCYFDKGGPDDHKKELEKFKAMGWKELCFNYAGGPRKVFGLGDYGLAAIDPSNGQVNKADLEEMRKDGVKTRLAHIDYPRGIAEFKKLHADRQAEILHKIAEAQHKEGFHFVYPVLYSGYDSTKIKTSKGKTIFEVIKDLIENDRK